MNNDQRDELLLKTICEILESQMEAILKISMLQSKIHFIICFIQIFATFILFLIFSK